MKKQYDSSQFDFALKRLESDMNWKKANDHILKQKLIRDLNKRKANAKFKKTLGTFYRGSIVIVVSLIVFIMLNQETVQNQKSSSEMTDSTIEKGYKRDKESTTGEQSDVSVQTVVKNMVGTLEQANANLGMDEEEYERLRNEVAVAKKFLTKEEFENQYIPLTSKIVALDGKANVYRDPEYPHSLDLLTAEEKVEVKEAAKAITPTREKFYSLFVYTQEKAQSLVEFTIKKPTYTPEGYKLVNEDHRAEITTGKPEPVISWQYTAEDEGVYYVYLAAASVEHPALSSKGYNLESYMLEGKEVFFGHFTGSNTKMMKMIVPARDGNEAYQIVIQDSMLNKEELEKILLSML
ncbi:hypothetical protein [Robertmurraya korlensis]|uniref:hypothetical protein n=1 Tax=Robertmurraya korlensis TaxID=519977 RepID=UPI00082442A0|nr:hypothetical protein [Robertmurraya korlensis]